MHLLKTAFVNLFNFNGKRLRSDGRLLVSDRMRAIADLFAIFRNQGFD